MAKKYVLGSFFLDGLMSVLAIILMAIFIINHSSVLQKEGRNSLDRQILYHKVFEVSEWTVKRKATVKETEVSFENWIEEKYFDANGNAQGEFAQEVTEAQNELNLRSLEITLDTPGNGDVCLFRFVVVGEKKSSNMRRIFICAS